MAGKWARRSADRCDGEGKVGEHLIELALADGAAVVATDVDATAVDWARRTHPEVTLVEHERDVMTSDIDIVAPCAPSVGQSPTRTSMPSRLP